MSKQAYNGAYSRRRFSNFEIETGGSMGATPAPKVLKVAWNGTMGSVSGTGGFRVSQETTPPSYGLATVGAGDTVKLTATANPGYHFVRWNGPVTGKITSNPVDVKMTQHCEVIAVFAPDTPGEHPSDNPSGGNGGEPPVSGGGNGNGGNGNGNGNGNGGNHTSGLYGGSFVDQKLIPFVRQWWWAILIVAYIAYKEWKGARQ